MNERERGSGNLFALVAMVSLIAGFGAGFLVGEMRGRSAGTAIAEQKYAPIVDATYPKPPDTLNALSGTVKNLYGASIVLEVYDPSDYLPHADGSPRAKQARTANVLGSTTYTLVNFGKLDAQGNPAKTAIAFKNLKADDTVTVRAATNIKTAQAFDVTAVEVVKY
ncbi:MAG: hypothetical protein V1656_00070 [Candidatus Jorgensenbacteria bacterium]